MEIPVITIDGPSGCGKGTISQRLASHLHWHWLDSGALYRALAWAVLHHQAPPDNDQKLTELLARVRISFTADSQGSDAQIYCDGYDISQVIRSEACGMMASKISAKPFVRQALLQRQWDMRQPPGLVADGRDMGTVLFPDAKLKFFLTASAEERARRRFQQLQKAGVHADFDIIHKDLASRDQQDRERVISPLHPAAEAILIDTTHLTIGQVFDKVLGYVSAPMSP